MTVTDPAPTGMTQEEIHRLAGTYGYGWSDSDAAGAAAA